MKLLGIGSDLGTGKVTAILKNKVAIEYQDGKIEFVSFKEAERGYTSIACKVGSQFSFFLF
jgi:hypothetical protein